MEQDSGFQKEIQTHATTRMDFEDIVLNGEKRHERKNIVGIVSYEVSRVVKFLETTSWAGRRGE